MLRLRRSRLAGGQLRTQVIRRGHHCPVLESLETRRLLTASVVGRYVFYNNSAFDGNDPAIGAADDAAIAPDKTPLFMGQVASFDNYTSYSRGINGVMIDVADLADAMRSDRPHRANGELAHHVLDIMQAFHEASEQGTHVDLTSTCERPAALPIGLEPGQIA